MGADLAAAVPFYGVQPSAADAARIKAPINAQYGELDTRITPGWPAFDAALTSAGVPHEGHIYKGANHGFHNDTTPRYDEAAAERSLGPRARLVQQISQELNGASGRERRRGGGQRGLTELDPQERGVFIVLFVDRRLANLQSRGGQSPQRRRFSRMPEEHRRSQPFTGPFPRRAG